ncbi:MAG TPA: hypothetical protein VHL11_03380, partial [Phototrophicaceae bacterium]|nr:hypothetical protein [Phototrophicaceae bacterium]
MGEVIQSIMLSDIVIFMLTGAVGLGITFWALARQEYAGYILGWLSGIFLILLLSTLIPFNPTLTAQAAPQPLSFLGIFIPGMMGFFAGVLVPLGIYRFGSPAPGRLRALIVAVLLSLTLVTGYGMLMASYSLRLTMGVFVLTTAIGALLHFIVISRYGQSVVVIPSTVVTTTPASEIPPIAVGIEVPAADNS